MAIKLLVVTPAYGEVFYRPYVESVFKLVKFSQAKKWEIGFRSISYAEISESRNYLLTYWFDHTDASHLLFIDADMGFDPQLIAEMIAFDKPVVGVAYPKRRIDLNRVAELARVGRSAEQSIAEALEFVINNLPKAKKPRIVDGFLEVKGCGAGILLFQRSCVETMLRLIPRLSDEKIKGSPLAPDLKRVIRAFDIVTEDGFRLSEDYSFCYRWRALCQGEIWVNIGHTIRHIGLKEFKSRYMDKLAVSSQKGTLKPLTSRKLSPARVVVKVDTTKRQS